MYKNFIKRFIDVLLSGIGIVVLALPMLIIALVIKIDDPGPVLFKQKRVGILAAAINPVKRAASCLALVFIVEEKLTSAAGNSVGNIPLEKFHFCSP